MEITMEYLVNDNGVNSLVSRATALSLPDILCNYWPNKLFERTRDNRGQIRIKCYRAVRRERRRVLCRMGKESQVGWADSSIDCPRVNAVSRNRRYCKSYYAEIKVDAADYIDCKLSRCVRRGASST
jgi:hypothetical protein